MSLQTIFGLPGEAVGKIPLLYSIYELEVTLRTIDFTAARRNWTSLQTFVEQAPSSAFIYTAGMLTMPRAALVYAWMYDYTGVYRLVRNLEFDVMGAADRLSQGGLQRALLYLGWSAPSSGTAVAASGDLSAASAAGTGPVSAAAAQASSGLGFWLWPLTFLCPGVVTCFLALSVADSAPIAAGWVFVTAFLRALCELRLLLHVACLARRRDAQALVQCLACSHGVPFILGCHALMALRLSSALLPPRAVLWLAFHLYGSWVPLACAGLMVLALQPNNGQLLEGAMGGIRHLGHRAAEDFHAAAHVAAATVSGAAAPPARRQHWPPPVRVPAALQEEAEHVPKHLLCPITHHVLTEPAVTLTGATYERSAIMEWLGKAGKDPLTGHALSVDEVFPNLTMYTIVEEYVREWSRAQGAAT